MLQYFFKNNISNLSHHKIFMIKKLVFSFAFLFTLSFANAQNLHAAFNKMLNTHVSSDGKVKYAGFKKDKHILDAYINMLATTKVSDKWSKPEKLSFWINTYNALTIRTIVEHYPIKSIKDIDGGEPWKVKRFTNGGKSFSLNDIENTILRPMGDARIHFAINCAAASCPPLANKAFDAENVEALLEKRTNHFINDAYFNMISHDRAKISKIFDWYKSDFSNLDAFLTKYNTQHTVVDAKTAISYFDYDWKLNE